MTIHYFITDKSSQFHGTWAEEKIMANLNRFHESELDQLLEQAERTKAWELYDEIENEAGRRNKSL